MEDKKRGAAEVGTICDTIPNESKNIIAHELAKGKSAVYLKRDGWTMMPQLPEADGEYLLLYHVKKLVCFYTTRVFSLGGKFYYDPTWDKAIAWQRINVPEWAQEIADEEAETNA